MPPASIVTSDSREEQSRARTPTPTLPENKGVVLSEFETEPEIRPYRPSHFEAWDVIAPGNPNFEIVNCIQVVRDISVDMARQARGKDLR